MARGTRRNYNYNTKPRDWRKDAGRDRLKVWLMLVVGLGVAGYIVYLAIMK